MGCLDLLAPRRCLGCDYPLGEEEPVFCGGCAPLLEAAPQAMRPPARRAAPYLYGGPLGDGIRRFKYGGRFELARPLAQLLVEQVGPYAGRIEEVIPMPLHPARLRARGFNQAALLAAPVARALGVRLCANRLRRLRHTSPQAGLDARDRGQNVRGAFGVPSRGPRGSVLLLDDVWTTGATFSEAGAALLEAGASSVHCLALCWVADGVRSNEMLGLASAHG
jgi:ComF family protein